MKERRHSLADANASLQAFIKFRASKKATSDPPKLAFSLCLSTSISLVSFTRPSRPSSPPAPPPFRPVAANRRDLSSPLMWGSGPPLRDGDAWALAPIPPLPSSLCIYERSHQECWRDTPSRVCVCVRRARRCSSTKWQEQEGIFRVALAITWLVTQLITARRSTGSVSNMRRRAAGFGGWRGSGVRSQS